MVEDMVEFNKKDMTEDMQEEERMQASIMGKGGKRAKEAQAQLSHQEVGQKKYEHCESAVMRQLSNLGLSFPKKSTSPLQQFLMISKSQCKVIYKPLAIPQCRQEQRQTDILMQAGGLVD